MEANPAACRFYGFSRGELTGRRIGEINVLPDGDVRSAMARALERAQNTFLFRHRLASGEVRDVEVHSGPVNVDGRVLLYSIVHDVTERIRAEQALRHQIAAFRAATDGMAILDAGGRHVFINEAHARIYGYEHPGELIGRSWKVLYSGAELEHLEQQALPAMRRDGCWRGEALGTRRDGRRFPQEVSLTALEDGGLVCVVRDTRDRKGAEQALRRSEEKYRSILAQIEEGYYETDLDGRCTLCNEALGRILGSAPADMSGVSFLRFTDRASARQLVQAFREVLSSGRPAPNAEWKIRRPDGVRRRVAASVSLRRDGEGRPVGFLGVLRDVTGRRMAEAALRNSEDRYRRLVELSPFGVAVHTQGRLVFINQAGTRVLGASSPEELLGRPVLDFVHPDAREQVRNHRRLLDDGRQIPPEEMRFVRLDGQTIDMEVAGMPFTHDDRPAVQVVFRDVTQRRQHQTLQAALFRIAEIAASVDNMQELYAGLHAVVGELLNARNFYIALRNPQTGAISFPYFVDEVDSQPPADVPPGSLTEYVLQTGMPLLADPDTFQRLVDAGRVREFGGASVDWLGVPLKKGDDTFGALVVQSYSNEIRFTRAQQEVLTFVSQHIAAAIDRKAGADALRASEARFRALADTAPCAIFIAQRECFVYVNDATSEIFGRSRDELMHTKVWEVAAPEMKDLIRSRNRDAQAGRFEVRIVRPDGEERWLDYSSGAIEHGGRAAVLGTAFDITERKRAEEQITRLAYHDPLTGLPNRLLFGDRLDMAVAHAHRHGHRLAVLFLDLDRFKAINDSMGHSQGDLLLRTVAERLKGCLREGDTVARLGGDEFILLLPDVNRVVDVAKIASKLLDTVRQPVELADREFYVSASMGISLYPADGLDAEVLIKNADTAMYRAKEQGRDGYQLYTPAMNASALERLAIENGLRKALAQDALDVHYQPVIDLASGRIHGVEALLRWRRKEGMVSPDEFIPVAELTGLIVPIGPWVLRRACARVKAWQARHPGLCASVNLSARQFQQADLVEQITTVLAETGFDARCLDLEITESNAMQNAETTAATLSELKALGVQLSIDDFGVGYSSLSYLKRLPIDTLKIDRSFVRDVTTDPDDAAIAMAVIDMAHALKLKVVAEGVETPEQLAFLARHKCDRMQGYLFSAPLPPDELDAVLDKGFDPLRGDLDLPRPAGHPGR